MKKSDKIKAKAILDKIKNKNSIQSKAIVPERLTKVEISTQKQREGGITGKGFVKGQSGNPLGKPVGLRSYQTIFREALKTLANAQDKTPEEIEELIEHTGIKRAMAGDYNFYKDIHDRLYGKAKDNIDLTTGGERIGPSQEERAQLLKILDKNRNQ